MATQNPFDPGNSNFAYLVAMMSDRGRSDREAGCGCLAALAAFALIAVGTAVIALR